MTKEIEMPYLMDCGHMSNDVHTACTTKEDSVVDSIPETKEGVFAPIRHILDEEEIDKLLKSNISKEIKDKLMSYTLEEEE